MDSESVVKEMDRMMEYILKKGRENPVCFIIFAEVMREKLEEQKRKLIEGLNNITLRTEPVIVNLGNTSPATVTPGNHSSQRKRPSKQNGVAQIGPSKKSKYYNEHERKIISINFCMLMLERFRDHGYRIMSAAIESNHCDGQVV